jgi:hypothetical protein
MPPARFEPAIPAGEQLQTHDYYYYYYYLWNQKVNYLVYKSASPLPFLSQINPVHVLPTTTAV